MSHAKQLYNRRYVNDYLEIINREGLPSHIKTDLCLEVQNVVITTVQQVIKVALEKELRAYSGLDRSKHQPGECCTVGTMDSNSSPSTVQLPLCECPNYAGATAT